MWWRFGFCCRRFFSRSFRSSCRSGRRFPASRRLRVGSFLPANLFDEGLRLLQRRAEGVALMPHRFVVRGNVLPVEIKFRRGSGCRIGFARYKWCGFRRTRRCSMPPPAVKATFHGPFLWLQQKPFIAVQGGDTSRRSMACSGSGGFTSPAAKTPFDRGFRRSRLDRLDVAIRRRAPAVRRKKFRVGVMADRQGRTPGCRSSAPSRRSWQQRARCPSRRPAPSAVLCSNSTSMFGVLNTRCCIAFEARRWGLPRSGRPCGRA